MKTSDQTGFSIIETLLILVVVGIVGFTGWYVYHAKQASDKSYSASNSSMVTTYKKNATTSTAITDSNPYTGWKSYTSTVEKITFKYPSDWTVDANDAWAPNDPNDTDFIALKSPDGNVVVHWTSEIDGFGNEAGTTYPLQQVIDKTAIANASGDYVVSGTTTLDGTTFYPWMAVENNSTFGILASGVKGDLDMFQGRNNINPTTGKSDTALFSTCGPRTQEGCSGMTKTQATAALSDSDYQQAKLILLSMEY